MSSLYIPDTLDPSGLKTLKIRERFARNHVFLRGLNWKGSDWTVHSSGIGRRPAQAASHAEYRRLISSAADLIVATAPATSDNIEYDIAVHATARFQEETAPALFLRLYGVSGRSITLSLQNPVFNTITSAIDQAFTFHVKSRDVGELSDMTIGVNKKDKACLWYCKKVIVKKGTKQYVFSYNNWLFQWKSIKEQVTGPVSAATRPQTAVIRGMKTCQTKKDQLRPTTTKPQYNKQSSYMESTKKLELPCINDGKVDMAKKANGDVDSAEMNKKKSPRIAEENTSLETRKYGSSERRPQGIPSSKKAKVLASSRKTKRSRETSDQVTSMVDKGTTIIRTSDDSKDQPLSENMYNITSSITDTNIDVTTQDKIQSPKYRRASSPARYVFFAVENKESSIIVEANGCTKTPTQDGSVGGKTGVMRRGSSEHANNGSQCSGEKTYSSFENGSSELALLQEILSDSGNNRTSGSTESYPFCEKREETSARQGADDVGEVNGDLTRMRDKLCSPLDCEALETSGNSCSCGEHSGYETDSWLDEEYTLSDLSLDLSLSEDEDSRSSSKFLDKGPECNQGKHIMKQSKHQILRQRRVESCSENSDIFQHSLSAIHNQDDSTLRKLCLSYFFLPSITDEEGKTLLHHAAAQEDPKILQVLLATSVGLVNIDQQDRFGKTALHYAVQNGNPKITMILLDNGAREEIPDKESQTVLDIALWKVQTQ